MCAAAECAGCCNPSSSGGIDVAGPACGEPVPDYAYELWQFDVSAAHVYGDSICQ